MPRLDRRRVRISKTASNYIKEETNAGRDRSTRKNAKAGKKKKRPSARLLSGLPDTREGKAPSIEERKEGRLVQKRKEGDELTRQERGGREGGLRG